MITRRALPPGRHPVVLYSHGTGSCRAETTISVQELAYPLAFFDQHPRGRRQPLLAGPGRAFTEVDYLP